MTAAVIPWTVPRNRRLREYTEVLVVIALVTIGGWFAPLSYRAFGTIYLLAVIALSLRVSRGPVLVAALASGIAWNFVFMPPQMSFSVLHFDDCLLLSSYFAVALIGGQLTVLRAAQDRATLLAESERLHHTLFDSLSHELKTPIAVLQSAAEQLDTEEKPKRDRLAREIRTSAQRLDSLVANLLNHTRLESGVLKPKVELCDAHDLVAAARRTLGERLAGRTLQIDIPDNLPLFFADAPMTELAILNLLLNAVMHTPAGTPIEIDAGCVDDPPRVFIRITDAGPGIAPGLKEIIFEKFQLGRSEHRGGLGLGLSIVRGCMEAQGGEATVGSGPAGGAQFTICLPRGDPAGVPHE